jgi:hypothetical protein
MLTLPDGRQYLIIVVNDDGPKIDPLLELAGKRIKKANGSFAIDSYATSLVKAQESLAEIQKSFSTRRALGLIVLNDLNLSGRYGATEGIVVATQVRELPFPAYIIGLSDNPGQNLENYCDHQVPPDFETMFDNLAKQLLDDAPTVIENQLSNRTGELTTI